MTVCVGVEPQRHCAPGPQPNVGGPIPRPRMRVNLRPGKMRILHRSCPGTSGFGRAKSRGRGRVRVLQHRFAVATHGGPSSESGGQPPHSPAAAGLRDLGAELSRSDCHNEHRPKELDTLDSAAPRNHSGALLKLTRLRAAGERGRPRPRPTGSQHVFAGDGDVAPPAWNLTRMRGRGIGPDW